MTRGSGEHEAVADRAEVRIIYAADGADRSGAVNLLSERVADVESLLRQEPIASAIEVRERSMHVGDRWDHHSGQRVGVTAHLGLGLRTTELGMLDDLLAGLLSAEPRHFDGPYWSLADESAPMREAQRRAVADARARAETYADAAGQRLGPLLRLSDEGTERPYPMMDHGHFASRPAGGGPEAVRQLSLSPIPITVRTTCVVSWALLD